VFPRALPALLVSLALLLQSLAPPGYMAGSVDAGWPVVLCPEGLPAGFLPHDAHGHHHEQADGGRDLSLGGHCPLGSVMDASAGIASAPADAGASSPVLAARRYPAPALAARSLTHPARAPPA